MSAEHIYRADQLIKLFDDFLNAFRQGRAPDISDFNASQLRAFELLHKLGPCSPESRYLRAFQERLYYLSMQNNEAQQIITRLMSETRRRLSTTTNTRRGLGGYRKSLMGRKPSASKGVWRGRG